MIRQDVINRLTHLGFEKFTADGALIDHFMKLIYEEITTNINWDHIPETLEEVYIDMVAGEILYYYFLKGDLKPDPAESNDLEPGNVTSITAGNMTLGVSFGAYGTSSQRLLAFIDGLRNPKDKRYLFDIVRKALD